MRQKKKEKVCACAPLLTRLEKVRPAGECREASRNTSIVGPSNGTRPQTRVNSTTPRLHTSTGGPAYGTGANAVLLRNDSGAGLYSSPQGVTSVRSRVGPGDAAAKVKSVRMTRPAPLMAVLVLVPVLVPVVLVPVPTRMLSNLRSACVDAWSQLVY